MGQSVACKTAFLSEDALLSLKHHPVCVYMYVSVCFEDFIIKGVS